MNKPTDNTLKKAIAFIGKLPIDATPKENFYSFALEFSPEFTALLCALPPDCYAPRSTEKNPHPKNAPPTMGKLSSYNPPYAAARTASAIARESIKSMDGEGQRLIAAYMNALQAGDTKQAAELNQQILARTAKLEEKA